MFVQIAAAKIAVDMETDKDGQLTDQQRRSYQASMRHEHRIYERLQTPQSSGNGIPRVYFAGGGAGSSRPAASALQQCQIIGLGPLLRAPATLQGQSQLCCHN